MIRLRSLIREHGIFLCILLTGLMIRLLFMAEQGLSNDELSGLIRTRFDNWNEFWYYGVKAGDMHPVFYQGFLWFWVRIFGESEWSLRATGLLFYILNACLIYRIGNRFFTRSSGLLINVLYAGLAFLVINTVFARPYNSGTFFVLLSFLSILEINASEKRLVTAQQAAAGGKAQWMLLLTIGFLGAMTSHYFAFITVGVMGLLALAFVQSEKRLTILICGGAAALLFLPHLSVTRFQMDREDGLGWLGPPAWDWLIGFFWNLANASWWLLGVLVFAIIALRVRFKAAIANNFHWLALLIFVVAYGLAHLLSLTYTPILKELIILFILPFLLFFLFGKVELPEGKSRWLVLLVPVLIGCHSIFSARLLEPAHFAVFRQIGENIDRDIERYGLQNVELAQNSCNPEYIHYYSNHDIAEPIIYWDEPQTLNKLAGRAKDSQKGYFSYHWTNNYHVPMYLEVIRKHFPVAIEVHPYFNSGSYLYKKGKDQRYHCKVTVLQENSFPKDTTCADEFIGTIRVTVGELRKLARNGDYVRIEAEGRLLNAASCYFTAVLERNGEALKKGDDLAAYYSFDQQVFLEQGMDEVFFLAFDLQTEWLATDVFKVYVYNPDKEMVRVKRAEVFLVSSSE